MNRLRTSLCVAFTVVASLVGCDAERFQVNVCSELGDLAASGAFQGRVLQWFDSELGHYAQRSARHGDSAAQGSEEGFLLSRLGYPTFVRRRVVFSSGSLVAVYLERLPNSGVLVVGDSNVNPRDLGFVAVKAADRVYVVCPPRALQEVSGLKD